MLQLNGVGHKSQDYWKSRRQSMWKTPYYEETKDSKAWKKNGYARVKSLRKNDGKKVCSQKSIERTPKSGINEVVGSSQEMAPGFHSSCSFYKIIQNS